MSYPNKAAPEFKFSKDMHSPLDIEAQTKILNVGSEAVVRRCSVKKVFSEISRNSQENTCAFCEISKNIVSYRTHPVAASVCWKPLFRSLDCSLEKSSRLLLFGILATFVWLILKVELNLSALRPISA